LGTRSLVNTTHSAVTAPDRVSPSTSDGSKPPRNWAHRRILFAFSRRRPDRAGVEDGLELGYRFAQSTE
jgi:hypothetical protein